MQAIGQADAEEFLRSGREAADVIVHLLERNGIALKGLDAMLDFGCGSGRVLRHWSDLDGPRVHGLDYNAALVRWVGENLPFVDARQNALAPPVPHDDEEFDFIYALSVFTHLAEPSQFRWMAEMRRLLKPGGHLLLTTQGDAYLEALHRPERRRQRELYLAGGLVVTDPEMEGSNRCSAYHPYEWVAGRLLDGFKLNEFVPSPSGAFGWQDLYLAQRAGPLAGDDDGGGGP